MTESTRVNCFNCRHCSMVSPDNRAVIRCGKRPDGEQVIEPILDHCEAANPAQMKMRQSPRGDRIKHANDLTLAYFRHYYPRGDLDWLSWVLGRSIKSLRWWSAYYDVPRYVPPTRCDAWSPEQIQYLRSVYETKRWPCPGRDWHGTERAKREAIIAGLAKRGKPRGWRAVRNYVQKHMTPAAQRKS